MATKWRIVLTIILFSVANLAAKKTVSADSLLLESIENLHAAIDKWNEKDLQESRAQLKRMLSLSNHKYLVHYYIGYADYNLVNFYQSKDDKEMVERVLEDGIEHLEMSVEISESFAEAHGLLSGLLGQKIGLNPLKGIYLGPKSGQMMDEAIELDPQNPRLRYLAGVGAYFTPSMFGGGAEAARVSLVKAAELYKTYKVKSPLHPNWGEREVYAWLGIIASKSDSLQKAKNYFEHALEISPDYMWVKQKLLPDLKRKMQSTP